MFHCAVCDGVLGSLPINMYRWMSFGSKNFKVLPLIWLDNLVTREKILLRLGGESITYAPHFLGCSQLSKKTSTPNIYYFVFKNARVSAVSSSVVVNDEEVVIERAEVPDQHTHNYAQGHVRMHSGNKAVLFLPRAQRISRGIFLGGNGSFNYYHWLVELLTKLEFIGQLPGHIQDFPLLISEEIFSVESLKETIMLFIKSQPRELQIILLKKDASYVVDELVYINAPNNLPFNLNGDAKFDISYVTIDSRSIEYLRRTALESSPINCIPQNYNKKIFLCRKKDRGRNYNQDEVFNLLQLYGFIKLFMEDLSFQEQVRTVYQAEFIVGPTGAAWTNLIFSRPGTKALCWMAEEFGDFSSYSNIARIIGVDLRYITYKAGVRITGELYLQEYNIDLSLIELWLKKSGFQLD